MHRIELVLAIVTMSCAALAQGVSSPASDNPTLTHLFEVDQAARQGKDIDWSKLRVEDEDRRQQVRRMLDAGEVKTGVDHFHALARDTVQYDPCKTAEPVSSIDCPRTSGSAIFEPERCFTRSNSLRRSSCAISISALCMRL